MGKSSSSQIKQQNVVIDIESEDLTYNQARSIRLQLQRDVEQLRNRVRMLRTEVVRAKKKINETKTKTKQMNDLQIKNDETVIRRIEEQQKNEEKKNLELEQRRIRKAKEMNSVKIRKQTFEQQKRAAVDEVKHLKASFKNNLQGQRAEQYMQAQYKKQQIHEQKRDGYRKMNEYIMRKREMARQDVN